MTLVLHAGTPTERARWLTIWEKTGREPFAHPAYVELFSLDDETAFALAEVHAHGSALLPLIRRPVPGTAGRTDAVSPYGYGGPFVDGDVEPGALLAALMGELEQQRLVSVFVRLSLNTNVGQMPPQATVVDLNDNVVVDLRRTEAQVWRDYEHKVRKNVNKAIRAGCTVVRTEEPDWETFAAVYSTTMTRRDAAAWYRFDVHFFRTFAQRLPGCFSVFSVLDEQGATVSVELVLQSDRYLYSFLGGTLSEAFPMAPNDLLKHEVVRFGIETGRHGFVLGGGMERGDGIFRYKRSFDRTGIATDRALQVIGDRAVYERLSSARQGTRSCFFPQYRAG